VSEHERFLIRAAAAGDEHAFDVLLEGSRAKIHGLVSNFTNSDLQAERDDLYQVAVLAAWKAFRQGRINPNLSFYEHIARSARRGLIKEMEYLRAAKRWDGRPAFPIDLLRYDGENDRPTELGSWVTSVDPLQVVLAKEELRSCWELCTAHQKLAIGDYMRRGGEHLPVQTTRAMDKVRKKVRPLLASPIGVHPTLSVDRNCRHCHLPLGPTADIRRTVHVGCRNADQWRRQLAEHTRERRVSLTNVMSVPVRLA
jgi:DNA-directed RNA polymerase specialized sigma24 family protein